MHSRDRQGCHDLAGLPHLPQAAIDQKYIRERALFPFHAAVTAADGLMHRRVVVPRLNPFDIKPPVIRWDRSLRPEYHTRRHRSLAPGVADIKALHPFDGMVETQERLECQKALLLGLGT